MRRFFACVVASLLWVAAVAAEPSAQDHAKAKDLFEEGKAAMGIGRFAEARELFQRSLELVPKASAAFNLAVALRGMGQPKEAHDTLRELLAGKYGELPAERRRQVETLAEEALRDVAEIVVIARGAPKADIRIDGISVGSTAEGRRLRVKVNPGERLVSVAAPLRTTVERRVTLAPGKRAEVAVKLPLSREARRATLVLLGEEPTHQLEIVGVAKGRGQLERALDPGSYRVRITTEDGTRDSTVVLRPATRHRVELAPPQSDLFSSPWFWVATGAVVVGASVGGYFLLGREDEEPVTDPEFGVVQTLRRF